MRLSIIICVYNTDKKLLSECLESIKNSTLIEIADGYEICMIDDGSTGDYSVIAKKYGARLKKTENRGIFAARAMGLSMAKGDFVCFCDSDDTVSHNYYLPMLHLAEKENTDIVINGWANRTRRTAYYPSDDETVTKNLDLSGKDKLGKFFEYEGRYHSFYVLWNKLYRTELLRESFENIRASEYRGCSYAEDAVINFFAFRDANRIKNIHTGFYFYRIHPDQSVSVESEEKLRSQILGMSESFRVMKESLPENADKKAHLARISKWEALMAKTHLAVALNFGFSSLLPLIEEKYGFKISKLKKIKIKEHKGNILLPTNFKKIDSALFNVFKSDIPPSVKYDKKDAYAESCMRRMIANGKAIYKNKKADLEIPKARIPLKMRIIHNPRVYRIGTHLFKKGSKSRRFLKRFF